MGTLEIPDFTISGVLPPFLGKTPIIPAAMSPYSTTLARVAGKLCGTNERKEILRGLIAIAKSWLTSALTKGFSGCPAVS